MPPDTSIIWGGDFNFIQNIEMEASGGNPKLKIGSVEQLKIVLQELDLCDIWRIRKPDSKRYTWRGYGQGRASNCNQMIQRRLDYFYISDSMQPLVSDTDIIPTPATDHSAISLSLKSLPKSARGPSFWKMNNSLLQDIHYVQTIQTLIEKTKIELKESRTTSPHLQWELMKYEIRKVSISFAKAKAKKNRNKYQELENKIKEIEQIKDWHFNDKLLRDYETLKQELNQLSNHITNGIIIRSKVAWFEQGERSSKYFLTLEKRRKSKTYVRRILEDNKEITDPSDILKKLGNFYSNIYSSKNDMSVEQCLQFLKDIDTSKLEENDKNQCGRPLTNKECYDSLKGMGNYKTPGMDGLSKEFYLTFWNELGQMLVDCLNYSFKIGSLSTTQNQVCVTLLEKHEKDIRFIENWRPISLINVDAKICSKVLCNRIVNLLPTLIHPNQSAFVKGRNIDDPIRFIADLLDYSESTDNRSYLLFAADFQKAFDSIEHNFLLAVLQHFGFGDDFVGWIKILLTNSKSCILNNGTVSDFFHLKRGTKQGDPISPYLFILAIEIMAQLIRGNKEIKGVQINKETVQTKLVLFADDATFCLEDINSLQRVLDCLELFKSFSSLQLNLEKSEVGWIGSKSKDLSEARITKKIDFRTDGVRILGIFFSHDRTLMRNNNFSRQFEKFKSILSIWKTRQLTLYGKVQIVRSLAISQLLYVSSKISVPRTFIANVQKEIVKFIWNGRKPKIKYPTLIGDFHKGGIRLPDLEIMIQTNRVKWALKLLDNKSSNFWKGFAQKVFEPLGGFEILGENFDPSRIKDEKIPEFYKEILYSWSKVSVFNVEKYDEILRQPIWLNKFVNLDVDHFNIKKYVKKGIIDIKDVYDREDGLKWDSVKAKGKWKDSDYFVWRSIIAAIPEVWRLKLKVECSELLPSLQEPVKGINISNSYVPLSKVKTKMVYWELIKTKFRNPTAQNQISKKIGIPDIEWVDVYESVYKVTNDIKLRAFQYKILNNCLFLNKDLYKFKLIESPNCTFCKSSIETMEHFFVECPFTKDFFHNINNWLRKGKIKLPELNIKNVIIGGNTDIIEEFLFLLYKYVLFNCRARGVIPKVVSYKMKLQEYEKIEYEIAKSKGKLDTHLRKYEQLNEILPIN